MIGRESLYANGLRAGQLDADQLDAVKRILKGAGLERPGAAEALAKAVAATMSTSIAAKETKPMTGREIHDRLRALYWLAETPDPPVGLIRARLKELPRPILAEIEERARRRWPIWFQEPAPLKPTIGWLANVAAEKLPIILPRAISGGGMVVCGRGRGSGRRSRPRIEPMIRGISTRFPRVRERSPCSNGECWRPASRRRRSGAHRVSCGGLGAGD